RALPRADLCRGRQRAQGVRARGRRVARRESLAPQRAAAVQRGAAERRAVADTRDLGGAGPQRARRAGERAALFLRGARRVHEELLVAAVADYRRQCEPGGEAREEESDGFLQAARKASAQS